ncbi:MAG: cysteine synthase A [Oscillospiraceae bacterium]|nr:cysteine synthase A [Oscillospiraceae bacterium]
MAIVTSMEQLIGGTPLMALNNTKKHLSLEVNLLAKLEFFNLAGSVKDRVALQMLTAAKSQGKLTKDSVIIEPTSGNTGIGLCAVAAAWGLRCIIVMPDTMSIERQLLMKAYGAEVVLTPGKDGMAGAIAKAESLAAEIPYSFLPGQFSNSENPLAHYRTTGPEIWADTQGKIDIFVAGAGTGGTVSGVGKFLKEQNPNIRIVAAEPAASPVLSGGMAGTHGIQGIGAGFVPEILDQSVIDEVMTVTDEDAYAAAKMFAKTEGLLIGISAGCALHAAVELAKRPENKDKTIVTLFPDSGERYLSTGLYK